MRNAPTIEKKQVLQQAHLKNYGKDKAFST